MKYYWNYLGQGLTLAKKNVLFYVVDLIPYLAYSLLGPGMSSTRFLVSLIFLSFAYTPFVLFNENIDGNKTTLLLIWKSYKQSFFRAIKLTFVVAIIVYGWALINSLNGITLNFQNPRFSWLPIIILPLGICFACYYNIDKLSFFRSLVSGFVFLFRNLSFLLFGGLYALIIQTGNYFIMLTTNQKSFYYLLFQVITMFISLTLVATSVVYFKDRKEKK